MIILRENNKSYFITEKFKDTKLVARCKTNI